MGNLINDQLLPFLSNFDEILNIKNVAVQDSVAGTRSELQTGFTAAQSGLQNSMHSLKADLMDAAGKADTDIASLKAQVLTSVCVLCRCL